MIKRLLCCLLASILLLGTVSCHSADPDADAVTSAAEETEPEETEPPFIINEDTLVFGQNNISAYTIIRPAQSNAVLKNAAWELQYYLKQMSGITIPIKTDAEPAAEFEIAIGYTNRSAEGQFDADKLGTDGFVIETVGKKLFIAGSDVRGALYGVYTFLEDYLGCRFYAWDYEKIPSREVIGVQPIARDEQIPVFAYREIDFVASRYDDFQPKLKANGMYNNSPAEYGGKIEYIGGFVHTLEQWIPQSPYPEYYGLNEDGSRQTGWGAQPCLTNPDVLNLVREKVRSLLAERPDAKIISISQPDNGTAQKPCMCAECQKIYAEEGAYSGAMVRFVNTIAREFAADYPDLMFDTLAYHHTRSVCKTPPAENVIIRLCTIECCFSHPLGTCADVYAMAGSTKTISEDIAEWGKVCKNIYVWDYTTNYVESVAFFPNFNVLLANARFFADHNVIGVYEEGNFFSETCDFPELRSYIMAKVLWNPYMSEEEYWGYIDEFLRDYYGRGWKYIREYIDLGQKLVEDKHFGIHDRFSSTIFAHKVDRLNRELPTDLTLEMIKNYESTDWSKYLDYGANIVESELVTQGFALFDAAAEVATSEQAARIAKLRLIPEFAHSYALGTRCSAMRDSITDLLLDFLTNTAEGKTVPAAERNSLMFKVRDYVSDNYITPFKAEYEAYNRDLFERAVSFEITQIYEGMPVTNNANDPKLNLKTTPDKWRPKT